MKIIPFPLISCRKLVVSGLSSFVCYSGAAVIHFDSATDFSGNFSRIAGNSAPTHAEGHYMSFSTNNQTNLFSYDTNDSESGVTSFSLPVGGSLTVSTDVRFSVGGPNDSTTSSVGIYFGNYLALLNVGSTNEMMRIGTDMSLSTGGLTAFSGSGVTGVDLIPVGHNTAFVPVSTTMTALTESSFSISFTVGSRNYTQTINSAAPTDFTTGLRLYNVTSSGNVIDFDTYSVNFVPEPSVALLSLGGAAVFCLLRQKNRA